MLARAAALLVLLSVPAAAEDASSLAGSWKLNRKASDDIAEKIKAAAGKAYMSGGPSWATETWFRWGADFSEPQRISLREFLLASVPVFDAVRIEMNGSEVHTEHGEAGASRLFNLSRESAGTSALDGQKVKRQARLKGQALELESKGKDGKLLETISPGPGKDQISYTIRFEQKLMKEDLALNLVYDRAPAR